MSDPFVNCELSESWKDWFLSRKSAAILDKSHKQTMFNTFNATITESKCKEQLLKQDEIAFLFKLNFGQGKVNIIHHFQEVGGNLWSNSSEKFGAIQGIQRNGTCVVTPDTDLLFGLSEGNNSVPQIKDLLEIRNINEIDQVQISNETKYQARNIIPIPPFMINKLSLAIQQSQGESKAVLFTAIEAIRDFDTATESIEEHTETASDSCGDLLHWLFLVTKNKIYSIPTMACCDVQMQVHYRNMEKTHLTQDQPVTPIVTQASSSDQGLIQRPLEIIASSSSVTREYLDKLTQIQATQGDKQTRSFKKIAKKYQRMMLVASSRGNVIPTTLNDDAIEFFSQSTSLLAQIHLNSYLESKDIECTVSTALATILMHGSFLWVNSVNPSGLSASVISSKDVINNDTLYDGIVLDYTTKHEISDDSLNKLTKTKIMYPTEIESTIHRIDALAALSELFFGDTSLLSKGLDELVYDCKKNKTLLKRQLALDEMFIPKLLYAVDHRVNQWLSQCCRESSVQETTLDLVSFASIILKIQLNDFNCFLPMNIRRIAKEETSQKKRDNTQEGLKTKKKSKQEIVSMVRNENINEEWKLKENESWNQTFRHKSKEAPMLSMDCRACLKYHVKGFCFQDCNFKDSHVELTGEDFKRTDSYIKSLRS